MHKVLEAKNFHVHARWKLKKYMMRDDDICWDLGHPEKSYNIVVAAFVVVVVVEEKWIL